VRAPWLLGAMAGAATACADRPDTGAAGQATVESPTGPADSLVATMPGGYEIWFTLARPDSGTDGRCTDRALEIRHDGRRTPVPLLYTRSTPERVSDTTFRARLSDHCAPADRYLVDVRTGRPVREP
jgi:hypothetical protein